MVSDLSDPIRNNQVIGVKIMQTQLKLLIP